MTSTDRLFYLRRHCKQLLLDTNLDTRGSLKRLAQELGVNYNSLSMALTGYRVSPGAEKMLKQLIENLITQLSRSECNRAASL